ncbi:2-hydroxycarboxylate transporter family protein [Treponema pedis]|uniref:2-hydroxycarboxylate transporter family protein n=1 Tax=Treponema pedis TaxID=409322 RepID=UPI003133F77A
MAKKNFKELFDIREGKWGGLNFPIFLCMLVLTCVTIYVPFGEKESGFLRSNFISIFALLAVFGILFGEIGDRIPFWNSYVGGGTVMVFFAAAIFGTYKLVPEPVIKSVNIFYGKQPVNFLEIFIPALIVGSVLTIDRKILIKSLSGYIPLIIIGVIGAAVSGVLSGLIFGKNPIDVIMNYVLPIMGGGTGAGAIPMSEMWASKTGKPASEWFAFAISILTIANIIAILTGAVLNKLGEKRAALTGNGNLVINSSNEQIKTEEASVKCEMIDVFAAFVMTGILFIAAHILGEVWESFGFSFEIHRLAFLIILTMILNISGVIPQKLKTGAKIMQNFFSKYTIWILMTSVGFSTDVKEILAALSFSNLVIALSVVFGAVIFIMFVAKKMKFYPIEAGITAGLCMANRGGAGDVAVLGAANRMELMSFAQISSRIGGAMMLILGSIIFGIFA